MKQRVAANISLLLAPLAWLLVGVAVLSLLGDYERDTPHEVIRANTLFAHSSLALGLLALSASTWLCGYAWSGAKRRALVALLFVGVPLLVVVASLFR